MDSTRLELFKNKEEHAQSANASQEVRRHLAGFIRSKQLQGSGNQLNANHSSNRSSVTNSGGNISAASSFQPFVSSHNNSNNIGGSNTNTSTSAITSSTTTHCYSGPGCIPPIHTTSNHIHHLTEPMADDHPLRKTASMPTMHVPYKAQSSSRRRQMERRTTMSPLMKRKSKPRRQLLQSQDSNSTEYLSSNPCMAHNHRDQSDARSLSQSSSPPPAAQSALSYYHYHHQHQQQQQPQTFIQSEQRVDLGPDDQPAGMTNFTGQFNQAHAHKTPGASPSEASTLSFVVNNIRELENLRNNIGDSSYLSMQTSSVGACSSSDGQSQLPTNHQQQPQASSTSNQHQMNAGSGGGCGTSIKDNFALQKQSSCSSSPLMRDNLDNQVLRQQQQQHLKVNEAIKRMQLASSRGKLHIGGSLDIEAPPSAAMAACRASSSRRANNLANYKDELRQWSLDGADLRTNGLLNSLQQSGATNSPGNLFNRDIYKLRMATTNDAASLRQSQSPSASILSGGCQMVGQHQASRAPVGLHGKLYSSSSSSTSSLLSQQDSLDDSSSQAIDLSSSSEASRNRSHHHHHHHHHNHHHHNNNHVNHNQQQLFNSSSQVGPRNSEAIQAATNSGVHQQQQQQQQQQQANVSQHYQKMLQESFNNQQQLSQATNYKQLLISTPQQQSDGLSQAPVHHPGALLNASRTAISLDGSYGGSNLNLFASLADQFNLSASAQNLISAQVESQFACLNTSPMVVDHHQLSSTTSSSSSPSSNQQQQQQPAQDHNQWLMAYNNLLQSSADLQQANQVTSSLLDKIPEPYKSSIWSHLMRQHQLQIQQQQQRQHLQTALAGGGGGSAGKGAPMVVHQQEDQRSLINRTLSSPLLMSAGGSSKQQDCQAKLARAFHQSNKDRSQQATVMMQLDTLQLTDKEKKLEAASGGGGGSSVITDNSSGADNNSIDLTLSSRSSGGQTNDSLGKRKSRHESSGGLHQEQSAPLNFNYTPLDPERAQCSFIYNPLFDEHSSTGLVYELEMCNHKCICANENNHPENSQRILAIWRRFYDKGLMARCARVHSRKATFDEIQLCHSETYSYYFGKSPYERIKINRLDLSKLPIEGLTQLECGGQGADIDTAWNEEQTPGVARLAAGCVIEAALSVAEGKLMNAFAIVRPPGHHAEFQQAMGFCFFNSVAIAAKVLMNRHQLARVLIVDWDVHHGNGIQKLFYHDNSVMYISLHRHDRGNFFPGTGDSRETGLGLGEGYNWNVAWSNETMGDAEYVAAFRSIVMPIARDFNPSMVLVACGFDGAQGHPFNFGGYDLSAACFAYMTRQLMTLANGRLVLCLEGGYQITAICDCAEACLRALLDGDSTNDEHLLRESELRREPNHSACEVLYEISTLAAKHWPSVEKWRHTIELSASEAAGSMR